MALIFLVLITVVGLIWFVSPSLSPIPYYPTSETDMALINKALNLQRGDVLYDLGAGNGKIMLRFANPKVKTVGVELNPYLVVLMLWRRLWHPQKKQISVIWQDLFKTDLSQATKIYLFVGPFLIDRIFKYILQNKSSKLKRIVSYRYKPLGKFRNSTELRGLQKIYIWQF